MVFENHPLQSAADRIMQNLAALDREQASVMARREAHLYEFARLITAAYPSPDSYFTDEAFRAECRAFFDRRITDEAASDERRDAPSRMPSHIAEQIFFCSLLLTHSEHGIAPETICQSQPLRADARVAYVRNYYADQAYRQISPMLRHPAVHYCEDYADVCDEIVSGTADYGILPLESASEGRLLPFRRLVDQYELKIVTSTAVESPDGEQRTLFVLLSSELTVLPPPDDGGTFLELTLPSSARDSIAALLSAASLCRLSVERIDAIPLSYDERGYTTDLLFDTKSSELSVFLAWMHLFFPDAIPVGLFSLPAPA